MTKYNLSQEEWWPVWEIDDEGSAGEIELTDEERARIKAAFEEFNKCQDLIIGRMKEES